MKPQKKVIEAPRLTGDQIVQKKLDEANAMLRKTDLSFLKDRHAEKQNNG